MNNGIIIVDKQEGWSSYDAVAFLRKICNTRKVGHSGTLDPLATGVLVIATGRATRLVQYLTNEDKVYETTIILGKTSTTDDGEGEVTPVSSRVPSKEEVEEMLKQYTGMITQVPPAHSAIRVDGVRAYKRARKGEDVSMPSRQVRVESIDLIAYEYPHLSLRITCSKGTYIRSLGRDMGNTLGVGGYLGQLRRVRSGMCDIVDAVPLVKKITKEEVAAHFIPLEHVQLTLPVVIVPEYEEENILHGRKIGNHLQLADGAEVALRSEDNRLLAIGTASGLHICVSKNFM